jgi:hypothetical protein
MADEDNDAKESEAAPKEAAGAAIGEEGCAAHAPGRPDGERIHSDLARKPYDWPWFYFACTGPEDHTVHRMCKACSRVDDGGLHGWKINDDDVYCSECTQSPGTSRS